MREAPDTGPAYLIADRVIEILREAEGDYWSAIADEAEREYRQMEEDDDGGES